MRNIRRWLLLAATVALVAVTGISAGPPDGIDPPGLIKAKQVADERAKGLFDIVGVVGVGVGATDAGEAAVVVLTESEGVDVPDELDGVPVVAFVSGKIYALCHRGGNDPKGCDPGPRPHTYA